MDSQYDSSYGSQDQGQGQMQRHSNTELFSSAKVVADAAQSAFRHDASNLDRSKVANATGDILDAAGQYGKIDDKSGFGKALDKAADYLHGYNSSSTGGTQSGRSGSGDSGEKDRSGSGYGGDNDRSGSGFGSNDRSGSGYGGDKDRPGSGFGSNDLSGSGYGGDNDRSSGGYEDSYGSSERSGSVYGDSDRSEGDRGGRSGGGYGYN